jgi:hypothetical protein
MNHPLTPSCAQMNLERGDGCRRQGQVLRLALLLIDSSDYHANMDTTGQSEFSGESKPVEVGFWPAFLLTLSGAAGLIALVANGPTAIVYVSGLGAIVSLAWIAVLVRQNRKSGS